MITLLQLDYFRRLAATEHITQTAKDLFISQTALSSMIISLEKELGVQLFDRSKRSIRLNQAGKLYLQYVDDMFAALNNGRNALQDLVEAGEKQVSLAVGASQVWLPMLRDFRKQFPDYTIKQQNLTLDALLEALRTMKTDYIIASPAELPDQDLDHVFLRKDRVFLCVPQNHPWVGREFIYLKELDGQPYIGLSVGSPWRAFCMQLFKQAGIRVNTVLECDYSLRGPLIEAGFGVSLTSATVFEIDMLKPNCYIPIADEFAYRELSLFWNSKKHMSKAALDFRDFCAAYWSKQDY